MLSTPSTQAEKMFESQPLRQEPSSPPSVFQSNQSPQEGVGEQEEDDD